VLEYSDTFPEIWILALFNILPHQLICSTAN